MEATGVEVVDGEGDVDVCLQGNLQGVRSDLPLGIGEVVCDLPAKEEMYNKNTSQIKDEEGSPEGCPPSPSCI